MRRREFITLLGGAAAWPIAARAQQSTMPVIGYLSSGTADLVALSAFREGLRETGFIEGQNVRIEYRWVDGQLNRLPGLATDLVRQRVAVIVGIGGLAPAQAAKAATSTIPIVFFTASDPVQLGIVDSLNRPGGNITGVTFIATEVSSKRLKFLLELAPQVRTVAQIVNGAVMDTNAPAVNEVAAAARALGRQSFVVEVRGAQDFETAFTTLVELKADAHFVTADPLFLTNRGKLLTLVDRFRFPTTYANNDFVRDGGLMSYGADRAAAYRQQAKYVGQILNGANPAELPVVRPTRFELVINLKTAKALGLTVPQTLLVAADEVIE